MPRSNRPRNHDRPPMAFFFTGAGLSADSGVPTFYGSGGVYGRFARPEDIVSAETLKRDPGLLHGFVDDLRVALGSAEPNAAHRTIAALARDFGPRFLHITQNIDDLVERAGFGGSVHVHGFLTRMRQVATTRFTEDIGYTRYWGGDPSLAPPKGFRFRGERNNSYYRPDVVLFGEYAPLYENLHRALRDLREDDIAVVIGTRGEVVPIGAMLALKRCRKVLLNLHSSEAMQEHAFDTVIIDRAAEAIGMVEEAVRAHLGAPEPDAAPKP